MESGYTRDWPDQYMKYYSMDIYDQEIIFIYNVIKRLGLN